jgi:signal transduction histidine kinase
MSQGSERETRTSRTAERWGNWMLAVMVGVPYATLAAATLGVLLVPGTTTSEKAFLVGGAAVALGWVRFAAPRPLLPLQGPGAVGWALWPIRGPLLRRIVYLTGLNAIAGYLMSVHPAFLLFGVTGLTQGPMLVPPGLAYLFTFVSSVLINTVPFGGPRPGDSAMIIWAAIIIVQTLLIGSSGLFGAKQEELSEERRRAVDELQTALEENAGLHAQLMVQAREAGVHDERQRLAREIHDTIAQGLAGIVTQLQAAERARDQQGDWQRHVDTAAQLARDSLAEARSVEALRPQALEATAHLAEALAQVTERWSGVHGLVAEFRLTGEARPLHPEVEVTLLRVAQESLANVSRHAEASKVVVTLSYMGDEVTLDVRDDGVGFRPGAVSDGFGLEAMRQRIARLAGRLEIESEPGAGTAIGARVPALLPGGSV